MNTNKVLYVFSSLLRPQISKRLSHRFYKAAFLKESGQPLVIEDETKDPHIGHKEVLVKVKNIGVNNADLQIIRGRHHLRPPLPFIPGFELSGEIEAVGKDVKDFNVGDRVLALKTTSSGGFAEKCAVKAKELHKLPHSLDYKIAASLPVAYGTAYLALNEVGKATEGEKILVLTAQGATGMTAIDLALNVFRCQALGGSDTEKKLEMIRPTGVLCTVLYTDENLVKNVMKHTDNLGVDIIFDTVGGSYFHQALECLKPGGQILSVGFSSGEVPKIDVSVLMKHRATVHGVWLGGFAQREPDDFHLIIDKILELLDENYISPSIGAEFPFEQVNEALDFVEKKTSFGKVVLNVS